MKKKLLGLTFSLIIALGLTGLAITPASAAPTTTVASVSAPAAANLVEAIQKPAAIAAEATPNSVQIEKVAAFGQVKTATCYNRMAYRWWLAPFCVNYGWGAPNCWYIETVCY